jgi:hypothetical protein
MGCTKILMLQCFGVAQPYPEVCRAFSNALERRRLVQIAGKNRSAWGARRSSSNVSHLTCSTSSARPALTHEILNVGKATPAVSFDRANQICGTVEREYAEVISARALRSELRLRAQQQKAAGGCWPALYTPTGALYSSQDPYSGTVFAALFAAFVAAFVAALFAEDNTSLEVL